MTIYSPLLFVVALILAFWFSSSIFFIMCSSCLSIISSCCRSSMIAFRALPADADVSFDPEPVMYESQDDMMREG